jgi:hypothetical protein
MKDSCAVNRFEIKYLVHYEQAERLRALIAPFVEPDPHNGSRGYYRVRSVYYDSPDFRCFRDKLDGVKFRRKLRIRQYDDDNDTAFLEIKQRNDQSVSKRRTEGTPYGLREKMECNSSQLPESSVGGVVGEALFLVQTLQMRPRIIVGYNREAYLGKHEPGLRITLDRNLACRRYSDGAAYHARLERRFIPPHMLVLEVKFNDRVPAWACSCLNGMSLQARRISKYCSSVSMLEYGGGMV